MRNRASLLFLTALWLAAGVPAESIPLIAYGKVVRKGSDRLVVQTDDHGHSISFDIDGQTVLPAGLAVGKHVEVDYHANGPTGQTADRVTLTDGTYPRPH
jgi:hypothetical protein